MSITIIDYGSGNLHSVQKAFALAASKRGLDTVLSYDPDTLQNASHIVLPGVGAYGDCVAGLNAIDGMRDALQDAVLNKGTWFFGICVGMQMMLDRGLEHGEHAGLGWIEGDVVKLEAPGLKIPHMGWNQLQINAVDHPLFANIAQESYVYFVHSYHAQCATAPQQLATTHYSQEITACIGRDNMVGTQFHPEKSQQVGLKMIDNFVGLS